MTLLEPSYWRAVGWEMCMAGMRLRGDMPSLLLFWDMWGKRNTLVGPSEGSRASEGGPPGFQRG